MRILYGVQTTGNGHFSRSRLIISQLKRLGHHVQVLFSGAQDNKFWDHAGLTPYTSLKGFTFKHCNGRIDNLKTLLNLDVGRFYSDIRHFNAQDVELIISDFEPVSTRIAKKHGIYSIGISHQCAFAYDIPKARHNYPGKLITKYFAPVDCAIGLHWHHFNQAILPPVINHALSNDTAITTNKILVYLPFENRTEYGSVLKHYADHDFHIYEKRNDHAVEQNLYLNPFSREKFIADLKSCSGVICQAGFELPSEAIHLGKKLLLKPVHGQYEQLSNAIAIDQLGYGQACDQISPAVLEGWLQSPAPQAAHYPDVAASIAQWINKDFRQPVKPLVQRLWNGQFSN